MVAEAGRLQVAVDDGSSDFQQTVQLETPVASQDPAVAQSAACGISLCSLNEKTAGSIEVPLKRVLRADKLCISVGRAKHDGSCLVIADPRVSAKHFIVEVQFDLSAARTSTPATDVSDTPDSAPESANSEPLVAPIVQCILTDFSTNGTFVNRRCIGKGQSAVLTSGDEVVVLPPERVGDAEAVRFVFRSDFDVWARQMVDGDAKDAIRLLPDLEAYNSPARPLSLPGLESQLPKIDAAGVGELSVLSPLLSPTRCSKSSKADYEGFGKALEEELTCPCCCGVFFRCTACLPCLHNFCAPCVSEWVRDKGECPVCREPVTALVRNCAIDGLVETLFTAFPDRKRSACEMEDLEARAEKIPEKSIRPATVPRQPAGRNSRACTVM
jgi:hypothetical protein